MLFRSPETTLPRWRLLPMFQAEPVGPIVLPVRDIRVLYGLKQEHYVGFAESQMPAAHEFFCPMEALMQPGGDNDPQMQALMARTSAAANFMSLPEPGGQDQPMPRPTARSPASAPRHRTASPPSMRYIDSLYG